MRTARNILFRAAAINYALIIVVWLISMTEFYAGMMFKISGLNAMATYLWTLNILAMWKMLNATFFLVPALAIWWQMGDDKREEEEQAAATHAKKRR